MAASIEPKVLLNLNLVNFLLAMPEILSLEMDFLNIFLRKMVEKYIGPKNSMEKKIRF